MDKVTESSGLTIKNAPTQTLVDLAEILNSHCPPPVVGSDTDLATELGRANLARQLHRWEIAGEITTELKARQKKGVRT